MTVLVGVSIDSAEGMVARVVQDVGCLLGLVCFVKSHCVVLNDVMVQVLFGLCVFLTIVIEFASLKEVAWVIGFVFPAYQREAVVANES